MYYLLQYKKYLLVLLAFIIIMFGIYNIPKKAYNVSVDGILVSNALTQEAVNRILTEIEIEENKNTEYIMTYSNIINTEEVSLPRKELKTEEDLKKALKDSLDFVTMGYTLIVDNEEIMTLRNKSDIDKLYESIKEQYLDESENIASVSFVENVIVKEEYVKAEILLTYEEAWNKFLEGKKEKETYRVKPGDTTWDIAYNLNMSIDDIVITNPEIDIVNLQVGQIITTNAPKSIINIRTLGTKKVEEPIISKVIYEKTSDLYIGESILKRQGSNGQKIVEVQYEKINGVLHNQTILSEEILKDPVSTVVLSGTKWRQVVSTGEFSKPAYGTLTSRFGPRWGRKHNGIDIGAPVGTDIRAADSGIVVQVGYINGYGKTVTIDHGDGITTLYGHASAYKVSVGQSVKKDQVIALVGTTGNTTGPCLHFEVRKNGVATDPLKYVQY